jgi:hypothetical protein
MYVHIEEETDLNVHDNMLGMYKGALDCIKYICFLATETMATKKREKGNDAVSMYKDKRSR